MYLELRSDKKKVVLNTNNKQNTKKASKANKVVLAKKSKQFIAITNKTKTKTIKTNKINKVVLESNW